MILFVFTRKVVEGSRERVQIFEGVVISRKGQGISEMYTVRKISSGIGVERTFPLHTPRVEKIEVVRHGKVRRAKLYYLRALTGKKSKNQRKRESNLSDSIAIRKAIQRNAGWLLFIVSYNAYRKHLTMPIQRSLRMGIIRTLEWALKEIIYPSRPRFMNEYR